MNEHRFMIRLARDEFRALTRYADARRRHPRDVAALIIRAWLRKRGWISDNDEITNALRLAAQSNTRPRDEFGDETRERVH
ncbi:MAG: hypothetical protein ACFLMY_04990 [Candidatus Brachytrichaceae bacterium NZ_4S206]